MTDSNKLSDGSVASWLGVVVEVLVVLAILFVIFILPIITSTGRGYVDPIYDNGADLEAQDKELQRQAEEYEREQRAKERQEEYEDYLEWLNNR